MAERIDGTRFSLERIGGLIHLATRGGPRDGATLCGVVPNPRTAWRGSIRGTCHKCVAWSRTIDTLREISRDAQATPYDQATDGL